jgi:hypothetical protein
VAEKSKIKSVCSTTITEIINIIELNNKKSINKSIEFNEDDNDKNNEKIKLKKDHFSSNKGEKRKRVSAPKRMANPFRFFSL